MTDVTKYYKKDAYVIITESQELGYMVSIDTNYWKFEPFTIQKGFHTVILEGASFKKLNDEYTNCIKTSFKVFTQAIEAIIEEEKSHGEIWKSKTWEK